MSKVFKNYIVDFLLAALFVTLGVITLPAIFGLKIINLILAACLISYLALFLFKRLAAKRGVMFVVLLVEFVVISLIAAGLVLQQFKIFNISGVCKIVGASLWLHGVGSLIGEYFTAAVKNGKRCPPYLFAIHIALVTLGTYMFAKPFISDELITWIAAIGFMVFGVILIILGIVFATKSSKNKR